MINKHMTEMLWKKSRKFIGQKIYCWYLEIKLVANCSLMITLHCTCKEPATSMDLALALELPLLNIHICYYIPI